MPNVPGCKCFRHPSAPFWSGMDLTGWGGSGAKLYPHPEAIPRRFPFQMPGLFYFCLLAPEMIRAASPSGPALVLPGGPLLEGSPGRGAPRAGVSLSSAGAGAAALCPSAKRDPLHPLRTGDPFSRSPRERRGRPEGKNPEEAIEGPGCHRPPPVRGGGAVLFPEVTLEAHPSFLRAWERGGRERGAMLLVEPVASRA